MTNVLVAPAPKSFPERVALVHEFLDVTQYRNRNLKDQFSILRLIGFLPYLRLGVGVSRQLNLESELFSTYAGSPEIGHYHYMPIDEQTGESTDDGWFIESAIYDMSYSPVNDVAANPELIAKGYAVCRKTLPTWVIPVVGFSGSVETLEGIVDVAEGDWLAIGLGVRGEMWPIKQVKHKGYELSLEAML